MKTLKEQGVSIITQTRTILSSKYGYIIDAGYTNDYTELEHKDGSHRIELKDDGNHQSFGIAIITTNANPTIKSDVTKLVTDVLDIVNILN